MSGKYLIELGLGENCKLLQQARKAGWTEADIGAIEIGDRSGRLGSFTPILAFVDDCVAHVRVSDAILADVARLHSPREIATMLILIGHHMSVARIVDTLGIELDPAPSAWDKEH